MAENGRIGGDPIGMETVEPEDDMTFDVSELEVTDGPMEMAEGGVADEDMGRLGLGAEGIGLSGGGSGSVMELREYRNDAGHTMMIVFVDGEPISAIPEGYYPVGDEPEAVVTPEEVKAQDNDDGGPDMPMPTPIDYQSLSMNEINEMVTEQGSNKNDMIAAGLGMINPLMGGLVRLAMVDSARRLEKEIERRLGMDNLTAHQRAFYEGMLEKSKANKPGFLGKILGKIKGDQPEATEPYSPEAVAVDPQSVNDAVAEAMSYDPTAKTVLEDSTITTTELPDVTEAGEVTQAYTPNVDAMRKEYRGDENTRPDEDFSDPTQVPAAPDENGPNTTAMRMQRAGERAGETASARARSSAYRTAASRTGSSIAEVARAAAPSTETRSPDYNDPRRGMKKGGLASKKKKKK